MTLGTLADLLAVPCLLGGALLGLTAGIGLLRFPDTVSRIHAATKPQVLGALLILLGLALRLRTLTDLPMLVLIGVFQLTTAPIVGQLTGRAAYRARKVRDDLLDTDELADRPPPGGQSSSGQGEAPTTAP